MYNRTSILVCRRDGLTSKAGNVRGQRGGRRAHPCVVVETPGAVVGRQPVWTSALLAHTSRPTPTFPHTQHSLSGTVSVRNEEEEVCTPNPWALTAHTVVYLTQKTQSSQYRML